MTGEISAAAGTVSISRQLEKTLRHPFTWVDRVAHGKPTLYLAQGVADPNPEWELEFWNRSIVTVDSLDATLGGPGPSGTPNITADGRVYWSIDPNAPGQVYDYAVEDWPCVDFAGTAAAVHFYNGGADTLKEWKLIKLTKPNRLRAECSGIYADGWSGPNDSTYFRFVASQRGWLRIRIARENWPSTPVHIQLAAITTQYREPALGRVFYDKKTLAKSSKTEVVWVRTPRNEVRRARRHRRQVHPASDRSATRRPANARRACRLPLLHEASSRREAAHRRVNRYRRSMRASSGRCSSR